MRKQQKILGIFCFLLPIFSVGFGVIGWLRGVNYPTWWHSISDAYYSNSRVFLIGMLFAMMTYFWSCKGYDKADDVITKILAALSFGVAAFPCEQPYEDVVGLFCLSVGLSNILHCICAVCLYSLFIVMVVRFTKSGKIKTPEKIIRNKIYWTCFGLMCAAIIPMSLAVIKILPVYFIIISETILQFSFAVAWLVKSEAFKCLNDK